jgi:hypothetical protein
MSAMFDSMVNIALVCILAIGFIFTITMAMKRLTHHGLWQKSLLILANFAAAIAIFGLVIGFSYTSAKPIMVMLITPNASEQVIAQLQNQRHEQQLIWVKLVDSLNKSEEVSNLRLFDKDEVLLINSVSQLALHHPTLFNITVLGDGLTSAQWQLLTSQYSLSNQRLKQTERKHDEAAQLPIYIQHKAYARRTGLINMQWQNQLVIGQQTTIKGQLQTAGDDNKQLYNLTLLGPMNEEIGSQILGSNDAFSFVITANIPGQWLYKLTLTSRSQAKLNVTEDVSVQVINGKPLTLLVKQSAPSFETRHLQNMLAQQSGKVLTLTKISKHKDIRQQINISERESAFLQDALTTDALDFFDIMIIDQQALASLSSAQSNALELAITRGLGVIVRVQQQQLNEWPKGSVSWLKDINVNQALGSNDGQKIDYLHWQYQRLDIPITSVEANIETVNARTIVSDQTNSPVVVSHEFGLGKVTVSLINTSYIWKTQGRADLHSQYWQWIFNQTARGNTLPKWQLRSYSSPTIAQQHEPQCIVNSQSISAVQVVQGTLKVPVTMNQQLFDANTGCIHYSPPRSGWYSLSTQSQDQDAVSIALYASEATRWQAWQQHLRYQATSNIIGQQQARRPPARSTTILVNPYWMWALLLASLALLWIERKYFS